MQVYKLTKRINRLVDEGAGYWYDFDAGGILARWNLDRHTADLSTAMLSRSFQVGINRPDLMTRECLFYPKPESAPDPGLKREWWDDKKPRTGNPGGSRRHLVWVPLHRWKQGRMEEHEFRRTLWWLLENTQRPVAHRWVWDDQRLGSGWGEGTRHYGPDGVGRTIDDIQHLEVAPTYAAAIAGYGLGIPILANLQQWHANSHPPDRIGRSSAERGLAWMLDLRTKCYLLGIGEDRHWADDFCRGQSSVDLLFDTMRLMIERQDLWMQNGYQRDYKFLDLRDLEPDLISDIVTYFPARDGGLDEVEPKALPQAEYSWQLGMLLERMRYCDMKLVGYPFQRELTALAKRLARNLVTIAYDPPRGWAGVISPHCWKTEDAAMIREALAEHGQTDVYLVAGPTPDTAHLARGYRKSGEQPILSANGAAAWCHLDRSFVKPAVDTIQRAITEGDWIENDADLMAPAIAHLVRAGAEFDWSDA